jgi:hypothetical protein
MQWAKELLKYIRLVYIQVHKAFSLSMMQNPNNQHQCEPGATTISNSSCSGQYACSLSSGEVYKAASFPLLPFKSSLLIWSRNHILNILGTTLIGNGSCGKAHACENVSGNL